jgi:hypothetical protein
MSTSSHHRVEQNLASGDNLDDHTTAAQRHR